MQRWGGEVQRHLAALPLFADRVVRAVAVYDAQPWEVPLQAFVDELSSRGVLCLYPRVVRGTKVLAFHEVANDEWAAGPFGIREPRASAPSRGVDAIDVFVVPGVAFTSTGKRLGRGGGYYDATLARRSAGSQAIGVCFDLNVLDDLPAESHDLCVDWLATERGVLRAGSGR